MTVPPSPVPPPECSVQSCARGPRRRPRSSWNRALYLDRVEC
jgi:hypothetical protein